MVLNKWFMPLVLVPLMISAQLSAMRFLAPEVRQRVGIGTLAIGTNFLGYAGTEFAVRRHNGTDFADAFCVGWCSTWFISNFHLLRSLVYKNKIKAVARRGAVLSGATFATGFLAVYLDAKLRNESHDESDMRTIIRRGLRGAVWTTSLLSTAAIIYETIWG